MWWFFKKIKTKTTYSAALCWRNEKGESDFFIPCMKGSLSAPSPSWGLMMLTHKCVFDQWTLHMRLPYVPVCTCEGNGSWYHHTHDHCNSGFPPVVAGLPRCFHPQTSQQRSRSHFQSDTGGSAFHLHLHYRLPASPEQKCSQVRNTERTAAHDMRCLAATPVIKVFTRLIWLQAHIFVSVPRYWSRIDSLIREALILRKVQVRLLISCWEKTEPLSFNFLWSLRSLCMEQANCSLEAVRERPVKYSK